ncbi:hypothetical protein MON38_12770 [Hymenobacter sp. DH14]|uniref:Uncharacterized protein n=1 Tax=Hymenobacter cyanobacteriorum TaxID=2926463 RepID=A0A9X1VG45_9BACT|nr:hypothetical protein [Hymenobacter cyanobacteriorum]MCI1188296.1 hypothetical protein [Hymenobacter cyanobacteriorum]
MRPTLRCDSFEQATTSNMSEIPEGWTDDMTVPLPPNQTVGAIADFVIQQALQGTPDDENESELISVFGFSFDDAALIRDRVFGGIMRAATGNEANRPDSEKDPFAHTSFELALQNSAIIAGIYPQFAPKPKRH